MYPSFPHTGSNLVDRQSQSAIHEAFKGLIDEGTSELQRDKSIERLKENMYAPTDYVHDVLPMQAPQANALLHATGKDNITRTK